jgi:hypothetical protein
VLHGDCDGHRDTGDGWRVVGGGAVRGLVTFDLQMLPQAVHRQLSTSSSTSISVIGLVNAGTAASDTSTIQKSMT